MNKKMLVVDDTPEVRTVIARMLEMLGYEALTAEDGKEALDMIRKHSPEAVIMDIWMPKLNGLGLLREIRTAAKDIKVIAMSGDDNPVMVMHTMELGACDFLSKPIAPAQLEESLTAFGAGA